MHLTTFQFYYAFKTFILEFLESVFVDPSKFKKSFKCARLFKDAVGKTTNNENINTEVSQILTSRQIKSTNIGALANGKPTVKFLLNTFHP